MTSRLKRKLERDEVDLSGNLLESFVQFGTALPSLADSKDKNEFKPVHQQTVVDDKGRRRLHGAFTGGFSAGYFNTVGSKEGWTPQTFTSSRANRAKHAQTTQDFMDDEDLADLAAAKSVKTSQDYEGLSAGTSQLAEGANENTLLQMIRPASGRIGEKLLQKMGWREGNGVGPRVTAQARARQALELGIQLDRESQAYLSMKGKSVLLAPLDRPLALYPAKDNLSGLGYRPGMSLNQSLAADSQGSKGKQKEGGRSMPMGGAFGLGAMEDADDDDLSVYDMSARPHSTTGLGGRAVNDPDRQHRPNQRPQASTSRAAGQAYNDGTAVLTGFTLSKLSLQASDENLYTQPEPPRDWRPNPQRVFELGQKALRDATNMHQSHAPSGRPPDAPKIEVDHRGNAILSANDRGRILGESESKTVVPSVFEFISKKNQERISALIAQGKTPVGQTAPVQQAIELVVPIIDAKIAVAALKGFMPFGDDKAKQARYRFYLEAQAGLKEGVFAPKATDSSKVAELNKELQDFAKSARVFKPMSTAMASRFTSGSSSSTAADMKAPQPGLRQVTAATEDITMAEPEPAPEPQVDTASDNPKIQAVRLDMFGPLTRTSSYFYPNRLLCKRFNVRDPHPDGPKVEESQEEEKDLLNKATMEKISQDGGYSLPANFHTKESTKATAASTAKTLANVGLGEDETQGRDILTYEKPAMDLFRAIFAESDTEDEEAQITASVVQSATPMLLAVPVENTIDRNPLEPVSLADFKPTFVPKSSRVTSSADSKPKERKSKIKAAALSFDVDADEGASPQLKVKRNSSHKDKDKNSNKKPKSEQAEEWVEALPVVLTGKPARARASDLM